MTKILVVVVLGLSALVQSCRPANTQNINTLSPANSAEALDLCKVLRDVHEYDGKVIHLRTWLDDITGETTVGDERCISRHPLVDVEFKSHFVESVCEPSKRTPELCSLVREHLAGEAGSEWRILGIFKGHFETYKSEKGFTQDGLRFRFTIEEALEIEAAREIKVEPIRPLSE